MDQSAEICAKMLLRSEVARSQTFNVSVVKGVKLQALAPGTRKWQTV